MLYTRVEQEWTTEHTLNEGGYVSLDHPPQAAPGSGAADQIVNRQLNELLVRIFALSKILSVQSQPVRMEK